MEVTPEMEEKIATKRGGALAILQLIREKDPDLSAKWEIGLPSPSQAGGTNRGLSSFNVVHSFF